MRLQPCIAVAIATGIVLAGCGNANPEYPVTSISPGGAGSRPTPEPAVQPASRGLPAALVGEWSGDDSGGVGSWTLTFAADGRYRMGNERRQVGFEGTAAVAGSSLVLQPASGSPSTVAWAVDGGRLTLDGSVYLRTDDAGGGDGRALVGSWLSTSDLYRTLTFAPDGTFRLDDPTGSGAVGDFVVDGDRLTLTGPGRPGTRYTWSVADGFLRLRRSDGRITEYTRGG
jgi:hypothetical protein